MKLFEKKIQPDFDALRRNILRQGTPERVHYVELFWDIPIRQAIIERFDLAKGLDSNDPRYAQRLDIALHQFLGYDAVPLAPIGCGFPRDVLMADDTTTIEGQIREGRRWADEQSGPVNSWEDFEKYPWPDPANLNCALLEWAEKNLPDGMAVRTHSGNFLEQPTWLMGYQMLCVKLYEEPDLVEALFQKCGEIYIEHIRAACAFPCVGLIFACDDMGFKTQTMISPDHMRKLVLPWHKKAAAIAHEHDKLYWLHACGNLEAIMDDLIDDVKIDAKHSFEDTISPVTEQKARYGDRVALLGGIDIDFIARADEAAVRQRVRDTLDVCHPGGGYCLGTGNSVANYIPLDNYLAMLDEGRRYGS